MGYDLHITRRNDWSDDNESEVDISLLEWLEFINKSSDLELSDGYRIRVPGSETESQVAPGFCEWTAHPLNERPWFDYFHGCVSSKNPDDYTIREMLAISKELNAKVQGDDGEIYELNADNKTFHRDVEDNDLDQDLKKKKPWWKFW